MTPTASLRSAGQSIWLDNITRELLDSGTLDRYIADLSVTGLTSNPTIYDKAIGGSDAYDAAIRRGHERGLADDDLFFGLALEDLRRAADAFRATHERTSGVDGWVSLEVSPLLARDADETVRQAIGLHRQADRPNLYIKIPGTPEGLPAVERAISEGVPVNVTLLFSAGHYVAAAEAYMRGLERRLDAGLDVAVSSVASVFMSRWDVAIADEVPPSLKTRLGLAVGAGAYAAYRELLASDRWQRLANEGARPQRLLFASTGTKDPDASDVLYVAGLAAPNTVDTMPEGTLLAFADHGVVGERVDEGLACGGVLPVAGGLARSGVVVVAAEQRPQLGLPLSRSAEEAADARAQQGHGVHAGHRVIGCGRVEDPATAHQTRLVGGLEDPLGTLRAGQAGQHVHEHGVDGAGVVEVQAARSVLPAHVEGEALDRVAVRQALEALEHHDHRHDHRRDGAPPDIGEEVREHLIGEQGEALPVEQRVDRVGHHCGPRSSPPGSRLNRTDFDRDSNSWRHMESWQTRAAPAPGEGARGSIHPS